MVSFGTLDQVEATFQVRVGHDGRVKVSGREMEVLAAVAAGRSNQEVSVRPDVLAAAQPVGDRHPWAAAYLMRAAGRSHGDTGLLTESVELWERLGARAEWTSTRQLINGV